MITLVKVVKLKAMDNYKLWVRFSDGTEGVRDYSDMIAESGEMVKPLEDQAFFKRAFVSFGVPTWPNGFDVDAINLQMELRECGALSRVAA